MKHLIVLSLMWALAASKPTDLIAPVVPVVPVAEVRGPVMSQYHAQDGLGQYTYGYSNPLSTKNEVKTVDGVTRGGYSYVDPEGKLQSVEYISDALNGFRVAASNIPISPALPVIPAPVMPVPVSDTPEVVESRAKHLEALEKAKVASAEATLKANNNEIASRISSAVTNVAPLIQPYSYINPYYGINPYSYTHSLLPLYINPRISPYITYPVSPYTGNSLIGHSPIIANQQNRELPVAPMNLPEVVRARNDHLAAVEKEKNRSE